MSEVFLSSVRKQMIQVRLQASRNIPSTLENSLHALKMTILNLFRSTDRASPDEMELAKLLEYVQSLGGSITKTSMIEDAAFLTRLRKLIELGFAPVDDHGHSRGHSRGYSHSDEEGSDAVNTSIHQIEPKLEFTFEGEPSQIEDEEKFLLLEEEEEKIAVEETDRFKLDEASVVSLVEPEPEPELELETEPPAKVDDDAAAWVSNLLDTHKNAITNSTVTATTTLLYEEDSLNHHPSPLSPPPAPRQAPPTPLDTPLAAAISEKIECFKNTTTTELPGNILKILNENSRNRHRHHHPSPPPPPPTYQEKTTKIHSSIVSDFVSEGRKKTLTRLQEYKQRPEQLYKSHVSTCSQKEIYSRKNKLNLLKAEANAARINSARAAQFDARQQLESLQKLNLVSDSADANNNPFYAKQKAQQEWARKRALQRVRDEKFKAKKLLMVQETKRIEEEEIKVIRREQRIHNFVQRQSDRDIQEKENFDNLQRKEKILQRQTWEDLHVEAKAEVVKPPAVVTSGDGSTRVPFTSELISGSFAPSFTPTPSTPPPSQPNLSTKITNTRVSQLATRFDIIPQCSPNTINIIRKASNVITKQQVQIKSIQERVKARKTLAEYTNSTETEASSPSRSPTRSPSRSPKGSPSRSRAHIISTVNLVITIESIAALPDLLSSVNAYVVVIVGDEKFKTKVQKNSCDPIFNEKFLFKGIDLGQTKYLRALVYSKNSFVSDEYIGCAQVAFDESDSKTDYVVPVLSKSSYQNGLLSLRLSKSFWSE